MSVHSLSKRSNLAGYRAAFLAGDAAVLGDLLEIRKHGGMMTSAPDAGRDGRGPRRRRRTCRSSAARYAARRTALRDGPGRHGFRIEHSEASLYLWATRDEPCWDTVAHLAELGHPGRARRLLRAGGRPFVRVALTATDERVAAAVKRLSQGA